MVSVNEYSTQLTPSHPPSTFNNPVGETVHLFLVVLSGPNKPFPIRCFSKATGSSRPAQLCLYLNHPKRKKEAFQSNDILRNIEL